MKKTFKVLCFFIGICAINNANAKDYIKVGYVPLSQAECFSLKEKLGLKYCPHDNDHLAGAAQACGHIKNLPTGKDLQELAQKLYGQYTSEASIYGNRNERLMQSMAIWVNDSHIYFWAGEEAGDGVGGYVRMFALKGSIPYYAPRDGSGYVSHRLGKVNYGETKNIITNHEHDSNLYGAPNEDVLLTVCYK